MLICTKMPGPYDSQVFLKNQPGHLPTNTNILYLPVRACHVIIQYMLASRLSIPESAKLPK